MERDTIVILGVPIDNLNTDETIERIFSMIEDYHKDERPRLVATVNVDFIVNTLTWGLNRTRHPELLDILRRADIVTADGTPIVWAGKLMGTPLKGRVTGADLTPALAKEAARLGKSVYFLGGRGNAARQAATVLKEQYPDLKIAGIESPFVYTEGEAIADSEESDLQIVERINQSGTDILLIGFGNPKQELWFERNRNRLRVPVSIGIGGTYEFIAGTVGRAPIWMQKHGLEWIFRITQDPKRLWKRYFVGFFKYGSLLWPYVLHSIYRRLLFKLTHKNIYSSNVLVSGKSQNSAYNLKYVKLPVRIDAVVKEQLKNQMYGAITQASNIIMDFGKVNFVDSSGLGLLVNTLRQASERGVEVYTIGINPTVQRTLKLSKTWDLFKDRTFDDMDKACRLLEEKERSLPFYYYVKECPNYLILNMFGKLNAAQMSILDFERITGEVENRNCIVDLKGLKFVDSSGIAFFIKLQRFLSSRGKECVLCGLIDNVRQVFKITKLNNYFKIASNISLARKVLVK